MATRPVFIVEKDGPGLVLEKSVEFAWHAGMAMSQKKLSMRSLHEATLRDVTVSKPKILEVSRMSDEPLGEQLSAFNLTLQHPSLEIDVPLECVFQSSKVFERGGPFLDLLDASPADAKRDDRLRESGRLSGFCYLDQYWEKEPPTAFYDWIYIKALQRRPELTRAILNFNIFTDIAFNPKKSINCQARAAALYVALKRMGMLEKALSSRDEFIEIENTSDVRDDEVGAQGRLF